MSTLFEVLAAIVALGGVASGVIYFYRRSVATAVDLKQADAARDLEAGRVAAMEAAQTAARAQRAKEFDAKAAAVKSPADAIGLLKQAESDDPEIN